MMKHLINLMLLLVPWMSIAQWNNPQSRKVTEKFFPEWEMEVNTPAFQKKKGFTDHEEMMAFLEQKATLYPDLVSVRLIGESQKGKSIPMIVLEKKEIGHDKIRVWMQGGLHGDEPASTEGMLHLIDHLLNPSGYSHLLDRLTIAIVPMANIDGYEKQDRYAANGLDLNRDQTKLLAPESVVLKKAYGDFNPHVAVDFHEYRPYRKDFARMSRFGITSIYDVMFLYSGNLNVPPDLRHYTESRFIQAAAEVLDSAGLRYRKYITTQDQYGDIHFSQGSANARSSATSWALTNTISALIEIRGVGIGRTSFKRRIQSTFLVALSFLQTSHDHPDEISSVLEKARQSGGEAVVTSKPSVYPDSIRTIDLDSNEEIQLPVTIRDALQSLPGLTRPRPVGYIIESDQEILIQKLKTLGLHLDTVPSPCILDVESFFIETYNQEAELFEGVYQQKVNTRLERKQISFDKMVLVLKMDQQRSNLAIELLEPEAPNSFVSFDVLHTEPGVHLPVYRLVNPISCEQE